MIELIDVWKRFKKNWVLRDVNLKIEDCGLFAIVGDNGSGKTTLLKIMCGLIKPSKGVVKIFGKDVRKDRGYKSIVGVLLHENVLYEELTVEENLRFYANAYGCYSELAKDAFKTLGLDGFRDTRVRDLSFGWKKRANLVRTLLNDPKIILLDEPLAGLDEKARQDVKNLLINLSKDRIVVFTSPTKPDVECMMFKLKNGVLHVGSSD